MNKLAEEDITVLDFIIDKCIKTGNAVSINDLINAKLIKVNNESSTFSIDLNSKQEFIRLLGILKEYNVCECKFEEDCEFARTNENTLNFQKNGGFSELYKSLNKKTLDWYKIIAIIVPILFGSVSVYFLNANYNLKINQSNLKKENDSLTNHNLIVRTELLSYKDSVYQLKDKLKQENLKPLYKKENSKKEPYINVE
ncbi:hypothetical protein [Tenacibaculum finnmarkense]|uniref:hypothetical protein n=1 Tax=Tenacibaculum finnmarkense TaxID=2781243 RepID=UPI001EFA578B|nr:hypothetical protein [Tenacibaculum finnmarkense]MCG8860103.1 hypothetical protein [Tenacibaculum finnmarkense]